MKTLINSVLNEVWILFDVFMIIMSLPTIRRAVTKDYEKPLKHYVARNNSWIDIGMELILQISAAIMLGVFIYTIIHILDDSTVIKAVEYYNKVVYTAFFPIAAEILIKFLGSGRKKIMWGVVLFISAGALCIVYHCLGEEMQKQRFIVDIIIPIFIVSFIFFIVNIIDEMIWRKNNFSINRIWYDLDYRTTRLDKKLTNIELIEYCEKYFDNYIHCYKKLKRFFRIEYVNALGIYKKYWYLRATRFMKIFILISVLWGILGRNAITLLCIAILIILVYIYKRVDQDFLYWLTIRLFGGEWGYIICFKNKLKLVGINHLKKRSKAHKFVCSYLNIAALCRMAAFNDEIGKQETICLITKNLNELFTYYVDDELRGNWLIHIPLWIAALFEFQVTQRIDEDVKRTLQMSFGEQQANIFIFLQSFWVDMKRKKLSDGPLDFILQFKKALSAEG